MLQYLYKNKTFLYKSAINNFLSETVNFFIKDSKVSELASVPEKNFNETISGKVYSMNIVISKKEEFNMFNEYTTGSEENASYNVLSSSLFGPPVDIDRYNSANPNTLVVSSSAETKYYSNESYLPYCPPYFQEDGASKIKVYFTATSNEVPKLSTILSNLKIVSPYSNSVLNTDEFKEAIIKKMLVSDCINYKVTRDLTLKEYDPVTGRRNSNAIEYGNSWIIQTKFECPVFNFNNCSLYESASNGEVVSGYYPGYESPQEYGYVPPWSMDWQRNY